MSNDVIVSVELPAKLYEAVLTEANAADVSTSEWIKHLIIEGLARRGVQL